MYHSIQVLIFGVFLSPNQPLSEGSAEESGRDAVLMVYVAKIDPLVNRQSNFQVINKSRFKSTVGFREYINVH